MTWALTRSLQSRRPRQQSATFATSAAGQPAKPGLMTSSYEGSPVPIVAASVLVAFAGIGGSLALVQMGSSAGLVGHTSCSAVAQAGTGTAEDRATAGRASSCVRYATFGVCLVPYRPIRRSQRNAEQRSRQHAELLARLKR